MEIAIFREREREKLVYIERKIFITLYTGRNNFTRNYSQENYFLINFTIMLVILYIIVNLHVYVTAFVLEPNICWGLNLESIIFFDCSNMKIVVIRVRLLSLIL